MTATPRTLPVWRAVLRVPDWLFQAVLQACTPARVAGQFAEASRNWTEVVRDPSETIPAARVQLVVLSPTRPSENAIVFDVPSVQC